MPAGLAAVAVATCGLTFEGLVDVVVQVVDAQAVLEAGGVLLDAVGHHVDGDVAVVLLHLDRRRRRRRSHGIRQEEEESR